MSLPFLHLFNNLIILLIIFIFYVKVRYWALLVELLLAYSSTSR